MLGGYMATRFLSSMASTQHEFDFREIADLDGGKTSSAIPALPFYHFQPGFNIAASVGATRYASSGRTKSG